MARVLISAAHTLKNPGEVFRDLREADLTRKIVKKVIPHLEKKQIEFQAVPLDLDLLQRIEWINSTGYSEENGDVFIEIHVNDGGKRGVEGWFKGNPDPANNSQKLTETLVENICKINGFEKQGVRSEYEHELGSLLILNQTRPISTAVECLYIDNDEDIKILKDESKLDKLAESIAESISIYVKSAGSKPTLSPQVSGQPAAAAQQPAQPINSTPISTPLPSIPQVPFPTPSPAASLGGGGGGLGGFPAGLGGFGGGGLGGGMGAGKSNSMMMDREERKDMITKVYKSLLGKEPPPNELNLHLNTGTTEDQLIKKLIESKDFEQLLEDAKKFSDINSQKQKLESEVQSLRSKITDLEKMLANLNTLLGHKNNAIENLRRELIRHNILPDGQIHNSLYSSSNPSPTNQNAGQGLAPKRAKKQRRRFF